MHVESWDNEIQEQLMVRTGLDRVFESPVMKFIEGSRVGLIANPATVDSDFRHAVDKFAERGEFELAALFGPQHGIRGETQDNMIEWEGYSDPALNIPVYSLYGEHRKPTQEMLDGLDIVVFDVQDVGTRIYTFIWTMALAMQACAEARIPFVVLDRPNPIGGEWVEGNVLDSRFASFVGLYPIPMRHGLTIAELAMMFNAEFGIKCDLQIVAMEGWRREMFYDETGLPWVLPSPNMPTLDTAVVYPGSVLFEGTNVSEGRGTTRPFELIGAPWLDAARLAGALNSFDLPCVRFRPCHFTPAFHKWEGEICSGVQYHITDRKRFTPFMAALRLLSEIMKQAPDDFHWKQPPYEYEYEKLPIDVMLGNDEIRISLEKGVSPNEIEAQWQDEITDFKDKARKYKLYD